MKYIFILTMCLSTLISTQSYAGKNCDIWEDKCSDKAYGYENPFKNNNSTYGDDGFYNEDGQKDKSRIETLNDRSDKQKYEFSNRSRNKDKSIGSIVIDQLQTR